MMRNLRARGIQLGFLLCFLLLLLFFYFNSFSLSYDEIHSQLQSHDPTVRLDALLQIESTSDSSLVPLLLLALEDPDPSLYERSFQILQKTPPEQLLPFFHDAFAKKSPRVRQQLLQLFGTFGFASAPIVPFLLQNYSQQEESVQRELLAQILKISTPSPEIFALFKKSLQQSSSLLREQTLKTLLTISPVSDLSFEPYFILSLQDPLPEIRILAIKLLDQIQSRTAASSLILLIKDSNILVRDQTTQTLIRLGKTHLEIFPLLLTATQNPDSISRAELLKIFYGIGKPAFEATPFVITCLQDSDELVQLYAAQCAGAFQAIATVPYLLPFLKNHSSPIFSKAIKALGQIQHPQAIPVLIQLLYDTPKEHRPLIAWALAQMPPKDIFPALKPLLQDTKVYLRLQALWILGELNDPIGLFALALALKDQDYLVRREAIHGIGKLGLKAKIIISDIEKAVTDIDEEVRIEASRILGKLQKKEPSKE